MSDHIRATIADLQIKLGEQEQTVAKTKTLINQLCEIAGLAPMYAPSELAGDGGVSLSIRSDQFYGQPLATCVRNILEMRKALNQGAATVNEIYAALIEGGFAFETKNEDNAKRGLRISITKNTALFHKLPNGKIGLTEWYPNAKTKRKESTSNGDENASGEPDDSSSSGADEEDVS